MGRTLKTYSTTCDENNNIVKAEKPIEESNEKSEASLKFEGIPVKIQNLDNDITEEKLKEEFSRFGKVINIELSQADKKKLRHAVVSYSSPVEAANAIGYMNGKILVTNILSVTFMAKRTFSRKPSTPSLQKLGQMAFICQQSKCLRNGTYYSPQFSRAYTTVPSLRKSSSTSSFIDRKRALQKTFSS